MTAATIILLFSLVYALACFNQIGIGPLFFSVLLCSLNIYIQKHKKSAKKSRICFYIIMFICFFLMLIMIFINIFTKIHFSFYLYIWYFLVLLGTFIFVSSVNKKLLWSIISILLLGLIVGVIGKICIFYSNINDIQRYKKFKPPNEPICHEAYISLPFNGYLVIKSKTQYCFFSFNKLNSDCSGIEYTYGIFREKNTENKLEGYTKNTLIWNKFIVDTLYPSKAININILPPNNVILEKNLKYGYLDNLNENDISSSIKNIQWYNRKGETPPPLEMKRRCHDKQLVE